MPKKHEEHGAVPQDENAARDEKFRSFFSTTVADIPAEMARRDEEQKQEKSRGLFGRLFGYAEKKPEPEAEPGLEIPTGEILLGADAGSEPPADMDLVLRTADPGSEFPQPKQPAAEPQKQSAAVPIHTWKPEPEPKPQPEPLQAPETGKTEPCLPEAPAAEPEKPAPAPRVEPKPAAKKAAKPQKPAAPEPLLPQEQQELQEMQQLKDMINGMSRPAPAAAPAPKPQQAAEPAKAEPARPAMVFAAAQKNEKPEKKSVFQMFGEGEDEPAAKQEPAAAPDAAEKAEDTLSLPMIPLEEEKAKAEPAPEPKAEPEAPVLTTEAEDAVPAPEETDAAEPEAPEPTGDKLHRMSAELTLRCVLSGILAVVLLHFGLVADRLLPALAVLDPDAAPAAFYAANLLLFAVSLVVGYPVLRDGLQGLRGRPSADTMPALAAVAALLQAVLALLNADAYRSTEGLSMLTGIAALGLFLALLGSRVMLAAVQGGYELAKEDPEQQGACRVKDKDLIRALARDLEQKDPWVLVSRPQTAGDSFVEQSLGERASERRARKNARILLAVAVLSGLAFLLTGNGANRAMAALTAVLCMGAPLSSTLIAGLAALRMQRTAAAAGAVVPGWAALEELGGVDTIQVDADDLFTPDSVTLKDIRIFKGGRIDRAILYAASILNESCGTLQGLFRQIVEDRTDILFPVKDLEVHRGLGFTAWCDNNRVLIGTRRYMEQEGVALPDEEYENEHSENGELQILYLAVSGSLHAMFVLHYVGGRNVARSLNVLQRENIRLLVTCLDPSLTAHHITEAYHLPEGMITLLDGEQCAAVEQTEPTANGPCCLYYHKGFASLTGGLQAADQAQNAENSATTVQMVSVIFSAVIAVLLTYAGSVWQLPVTYVLMYQAAWSGLSLAVCALKQHN